MWLSKSGLKKKLLGSPLTQLILTSLLTSIFSYPLELSRMSNTLFVAELLKECKEGPQGFSHHFTSQNNTHTHSFQSFLPFFHYLTPPEPRSILCSQSPPTIILHLSLILILKSFLMILTFGNRVPGGLFMPSMVVGCCFGRLVGTVVEYYLPILWTSPPSTTIIPGVYAMVGAAATLSGVTRMTVSLSVIMFELTGGLQYVLPIMAGIMTSKWVADSLTHKDSIYDRIIQENGFPYLNHKHSLALEKSGKVEDKEIMTPLSSLITLDMNSYYTVQDIQLKLDLVQGSDEDLAGLDGGFPLVNTGDVLVGFISYTDLQHALYLVQAQHGEIVGFKDLAQAHTFSPSHPSHHHHLQTSRLSPPSTISTPFFQIHHPNLSAPLNPAPDLECLTQPTQPVFDLSQWVDKAPLQVSNLSCCELVVELFSKLGVRSVIVVGAGGVIVGLVHKKKVLEFLDGKKSRQGR
jgi:chloride channel 3/4/5